MRRGHRPKKKTKRATYGPRQTCADNARNKPLPSHMPRATSTILSRDTLHERVRGIDEALQTADARLKTLLHDPHPAALQPPSISPSAAPTAFIPAPSQPQLRLEPPPHPLPRSFRSKWAPRLRSRLFPRRHPPPPQLPCSLRPPCGETHRRPGRYVTLAPHLPWVEVIRGRRHTSSKPSTLSDPDRLWS